MAIDLLVICASSGENLSLAERFAAAARGRGQQVDLLDLTTLELPLYTSRVHGSTGVPATVGPLGERLAAARRWVICAPEYNGTIPPVLTNAVAWLSVQGDDFRHLFNRRPVVIASHSGGGGMGLLTALRLHLVHLGANVVGRQLLATAARPAQEESIHDLLERLEALSAA
ncbi:MAG: NAD(P)H-dependent oxidoreductase [Cyanobacteriota bacterium]|jgi:NAD(P)H-dependent FMN reductase|nr:NAD(P)H-dependent oxidoreductase [Cyanobacteriota bacterium]